MHMYNVGRLTGCAHHSCVGCTHCSRSNRQFIPLTVTASDDVCAFQNRTNADSSGKCLGCTSAVQWSVSSGIFTDKPKTHFCLKTPTNFSFCQAAWTCYEFLKIFKLHHVNHATVKTSFKHGMLFLVRILVCAYELIQWINWLKSPYWSGWKFPSAPSPLLCIQNLLGLALVHRVYSSGFPW